MPTSLDDVLALAASGQIDIIAGGTDYYPALGERLPRREVLDITRVPELRGIKRVSDGWRIGGATRWTDIIRSPLPAAFDGLKLAAREVGSIQIQNAGTIAGNLCNASPAADGVPALLALDADVELTSVTGTRLVPLADFITGVRRTCRARDEILTALLIPEIPGTATSSFLKLGSRKYLVISIAMVSVLAWPNEQGDIDTARIVVGACSPVAVRLPSLEANLAGRALAGLRPGQIVTADHLGPLAPISDVRGSAGYRLDAAATLCERAILAATETWMNHHG